MLEHTYQAKCTVTSSQIWNQNPTPAILQATNGIWLKIKASGKIRTASVHDQQRLQGWSYAGEPTPGQHASSVAGEKGQTERRNKRNGKVRFHLAIHSRGRAGLHNCCSCDVVSIVMNGILL